MSCRGVSTGDSPKADIWIGHTELLRGGGETETVKGDLALLLELESESCIQNRC